MNYTAQSLVEMSSLRNQLIDRVEVLSKVKALFLISGIEMMSTNMVADFYEVDPTAIRTLYGRNKEEIFSDGVKAYTGRELFDVCQLDTHTERTSRKSFDIQVGDKIFSIGTARINYFSPRAVLRIGMLLRDSEVAKEVRTQLLNTFECATEEQKTEAIDQEGVMLLSIIRAGSPELMAVELGKYRDFMNRHIAKLETAVEELTEIKGDLETELKILYEGAARWGNKEVAKKLISCVSAKRLTPYGSVWNELYSNLVHACGMNLRARSGGGTIISRVREDEWPKVMRQVALLANQAGVDIVRSVGELNAELVPQSAV